MKGERRTCRAGQVLLIGSRGPIETNNPHSTHHCSSLTLPLLLVAGVGQQARCWPHSLPHKLKDTVLRVCFLLSLFMPSQQTESTQS